jgi:[ribosomal protein S5]-alanine N-acetyltransferase
VKRFPLIETERLKLRRLNPDDREAVYQLFASGEVTKFYDISPFTTMKQADFWINKMKERFDSKSGVRWAIVDKLSGDLMGTCGFVWKSHNFSGVLGYELAPAYWGKGFVTEAVSAIIDAAFDSACPFQLNRVEAYTYPQNQASQNVLIKQNFEFEGVLKDYGFWKEQFHDLSCYSMLRKNRQH